MNENMSGIMSIRTRERLLNEIREESLQESDSYSPRCSTVQRPRLHYSGILESEFESFGWR